MNFKEIKVFGYKPSLIESLIGAVILIIILLWIRNKIIQAIDSAREKKEENKINQQINEGDLSYDLQTYKNLADKLETAMDAPNNFGTDEDAIYAVFRKMETKSDVLQLIKSFGKRGYRAMFQIGRDQLPLSGWLAKELTISELEKVNKLLSDKNINMQF